MKKQMIFGLMMTALCASTFAAEGNGGGVNGPDLKGTAIPVKMDREIEVVKLQEMVKECKTKYASSVWRTIYGREPKASIFSVDTFGTGADLGMWERIEKNQIEAGRTEVYGLIAINMNMNFTFASPLMISKSSPTSTTGVHIAVVGVATLSSLVDMVAGTAYVTGLYETENSAPLRLPYLSFVPKNVDQSYDDLGNLIKERVIAASIKLNNANLAPFTLTNAFTKREARLKLDTRSLQDCLLAGLQK
jgi:hypothetical protein